MRLLVSYFISMINVLYEDMDEDNAAVDDQYSGDESTFLINNPPVLYEFSTEYTKEKDTVDNRLQTVQDNSDNLIRFHYISDIHLDHKINAKFGGNATQEQLTEYVDDVVKSILQKDMDIILIAGDLAFNYSLNNLFYSRLRAHDSLVYVFVVLGNHELTGIGLDIPKDVDRRTFIIDSYREMLSRYHVTLLENDLYCFMRSKSSKLLNREAVISSSDDQLKSLFTECPFLIYGGTGYSGLDPFNNATTGLYAETLTDIEVDRSLSREFEAVYDRLRPFSGDVDIIVLTHMPERDWCSGTVQPGFRHVNGHTHTNQRIVTDDLISYHDNQIGYGERKISMKYFYLERYADYFRFYNDGLYNIDLEQYKNFYHCLDIWPTCNRTLNIIMLKKDGFYMFLNKGHKTLSLLDGGLLLGLNHKDIDYYYQHMTEYATKIICGFSKIQETLEQISKAVKSFGGDGTIHGCIVDIDYYNHLYYNIFDGSVIPYYATDIVNKIVYSDLPSLLYSRSPVLYSKMNKLQSSDDKSLMQFKPGSLIDPGTEYRGTDIYRVSKRAKSHQYLLEDRIIRSWDDKLITGPHNNSISIVHQEIVSIAKSNEASKPEIILD